MLASGWRGQLGPILGRLAGGSTPWRVGSWVRTGFLIFTAAICIGAAASRLKGGKGESGGESSGLQLLRGKLRSIEAHAGRHRFRPQQHDGPLKRRPSDRRTATPVVRNADEEHHHHHIRNEHPPRQQSSPASSDSSSSIPLTPAPASAPGSSSAMTSQSKEFGASINRSETSPGSVKERLTALNLEEPDFVMLGDDNSRYGDLSVAQIEASIQDRRNRIFQLMEEVRRLRIQQRIKAKSPGSRGTQTVREAQEEETFPSALPYFPPITKNTIQDYINFYSIATPAIIIFGGLFAPLLEVRMGLGGASYYEFITGVGLPPQLAEVDPIVASFCGGMIGVLSALLVVELNNAKAQAAKVCTFCSGTGYLTCGYCGGDGLRNGGGCKNCGGLGKVMCTSCAATGKKVFSEHDPRIDPFN